LIKHAEVLKKVAKLSKQYKPLIAAANQALRLFISKLLSFGLTRLESSKFGVTLKLKGIHV